MCFIFVSVLSDSRRRNTFEIGVTEDLLRDQDAISKYFQRHPGEKEAHVKFIEKRKMNSYPSDFEKDDFVLHIPGCGGKTYINFQS